MLYVISYRTSVVAAIALAILHISMPCSAALAIHSPKSVVVAAAPSAPASATAPTVTAPIKSYREWKQTMISDAGSRVKSLKENLWKSRTSASSTTEAALAPGLQNMIDKEELQFSLAQDLTISDYFVGYLTKQKSLSTAIKEISGRLSAEEVAELMTAYADNFFSSKPAPVIQAPRADSGL